MQCQPVAGPDALAARPSPYDSTMPTVGEAQAKLCYSRPYVKGRLVFGGLVPYDTLWRIGANELTILHLSSAAEIAGIEVDAGDYSIYTVPSPDSWTVVVNASTSQWGLTNDVLAEDGSVQFANAYTDQVRSQEVGRAPIATEAHDFTEQFAASFGTASGSEVDLYFDWAATRITVPLRLSIDGS